MSKVSIIIPIYNAEKYLVEALESILNQTHSHFEFIIIEDASTDGSLKIQQKRTMICSKGLIRD